MIMEEEKNREKLNIQDDPETAVIRETPEETDKPKDQEVPDGRGRHRIRRIRRCHYLRQEPGLLQYR